MLILYVIFKIMSKSLDKNHLTDLKILFEFQTSKNLVFFVRQQYTKVIHITKKLEINTFASYTPLTRPRKKENNDMCLINLFSYLTFSFYTE